MSEPAQGLPEHFEGQPNARGGRGLDEIATHGVPVPSDRPLALAAAELSKRIDWSSLELQPTSFVDERLSGRQADVLFTIQCQGRKTYLYVLLEHQSTPDALMAFRLLRYLVRIWEAFLVEHPESERLPAILPVVVHHSPRGWTAATDLCSLIDADPDTLALLMGYIPQFRFVLDDLSHADDRALRGRSLTSRSSCRQPRIRGSRPISRSSSPESRTISPRPNVCKRSWAPRVLRARRM